MAVFDGFESLQGGMNSAVSPSLIQKTEIARGVNVDLRNGHARTRKSFIRNTMTGPAGVVKTIEAGKYQGGCLYRYAGKDYIVFGVFGRIYMLDTETVTVTDITPATTLSSVVDRLFFCQANEYLIIQDGFNRPIIVNGITARFSTCGSDPDLPEVPVGTIMVFGQGRLFVVVDGKYFMAGDIYLPWEPERVLQFTETQYLNGGGAFGLPAWMGNITGMMFQPNVVSGTGLGALVVFAEKGVSSFGVQAARSTWNSTDIARVLYQDGGGTGPASLVSVGNDIFYLGTDGLRSLKVTASESQGGGSLQSLPLSRKVQSLVDDETPWAYQFASGVVHDNRLYFTSIARQRKVTNPFAVDVDDYYFEGLLTIDLLGLTNQPMLYEGISTGCRFIQVFEVERFGRKQLVLFGAGNNNTIGFYTREEAELDNRVSRPECRVYTAALDFQTPTPIQKRFIYAEVWLSEIRGVIDMDVYYRPEGYPVWTKAGSTRFVAKDSDTGEHNVLRQIRQRVRISDDTNGLAPDDSEGRNLLVGAKIQFCFAWKGSCQLDRVLVVAEPLVDEVRTGDNDETQAFELTGTALMDYDYLAV
jgi:hypothetical protein